MTENNPSTTLGTKAINIVMFNMSSYFDWQRGISNRNWHILNTLLKDNRVKQIIAIDYLPWTWQKVIKNYMFGYLGYDGQSKVIFKNSLTKARKFNDKLTVITSVASYFSEKKLFKDINEVLARLEIKDNYICWSYNPLLTSYYDQLKPQLQVFDAVDNWSLHPSYKSIVDKITDNYKIITENSNIIFTVAKELEQVFNDNNKVFWIPNGIDWQHYNQEYSLVDKQIADIKHPIIGYIGIILGRLNMDIIKYVAAHNPKKSIVLVGSYKGYWYYWDKKVIKELKAYPNIHLLGYVSYDQAPMYIQQFDIAIIPHDIKTYVSSTNPMKMYEYLACGKPVVATPGPGLNMFPEIKTANDPQQFNDLIISELKSDSQVKQKARKDLIKEHSWQNRVEQMLNLIYEQL